MAIIRSIAGKKKIGQVTIGKIPWAHLDHTMVTTWCDREVFEHAWACALLLRDLSWRARRILRRHPNTDLAVHPITLRSRAL